MDGPDAERPRHLFLRKKLVVVGFYRYVRNPMYVGFFVGWVGLWVIFGRANRAALTVAHVAVVAVGLFVRFYQEPTLRAKFGAVYFAVFGRAEEGHRTGVQRQVL